MFKRDVSVKTNSTSLFSLFKKNLSLAALLLVWLFNKTVSHLPKYKSTDLKTIHVLKVFFVTFRQNWQPTL